VRLFVAVYPPPVALDHLAGAVSGLRLGAAVAAGQNPRLVARPLWHVTLAFLGEVAEHRVPRVVPALVAGIDGWRDRGGQPPLRLRLAGGGRFGRRRFTVLWVGLAGDLDGLVGLVGLGRSVRRGLRRGRLPHDRKPLHPHLTLARPGDRLSAEEVAADLSALSSYQGPAWELTELHLVRSTQGPRPAHESLARLPLAEPG
jgi:2'-5' RNA ligase